jgi:hypothetical protein
MVAAALLGVGVSTAPQAKAANIFWDVNSNIGGAGGTGNWDTTSAFWYNAGSGTTTTGANPTSAATFTTADTAYFTGLAGTATLQQGVTVGGLYFGTPGFTIAGANTLTLNTGASVNTVGDATISSVVAGTTFTKSGSGILTLAERRGHALRRHAEGHDERRRARHGFADAERLRFHAHLGQ